MHISSLSRPSHGGNLSWAAALADCPPDQILDFSASINPLGPPQSAIAAIHAHLEQLRHYPDPDYGALRQALSTACGLPPEWILPGNGSAELLTWASRDLSSLRSVLLPRPAFGDYERALRAFDAEIMPCLFPVSLPIEPAALLPRLDEIDTLTLDTQAAGLILNNPHNPTGQLLSRHEIRPYLEAFGLVVVDEAFMDFLLPGEQQSVMDWVTEYPNLVVLRSLTKLYSLPGLRLGFAIAHPDRLRRWQRWRDPWSVNALAVAAGISVLQDEAFQQQTWAWLPDARAKLFEGLAAIAGLTPLLGSANFLLVQSESVVSQLQKELLQRHQILIRDCLSFPELGDRYFRVAVRTPAENQRLLNALATVL